MIMDKVISNQWDARISIQVINDVMNIKYILRVLCVMHDSDKMRGSDMYNRYCATLHQHLLGWS